MKSIHPSWQIKDACVKGLSHIASVLTLPPEYYKKRIQKVGFTGRSARLLDAACGSGIWAFAASYLNKRVEGIDATEKYLVVAKEINEQLGRKNLQLKLGRLEKLPYKDKYFDYVLCYNAWMYTARPKSLKEMYRVLKPGGKIYLGCIAGLGYYLMLIWQGIKEGNRGLIFTALRAIKYRVFMTEKESRGLLEKQGFKVMSFAPDGQIGDQRIEIEPVYPAKKYGFWCVYEILAIKPE